MQVECEICGKYFEQTRSTQKYCEDCRPNSDKLKIQYGREIGRSSRTYREPNVRQFVCIQCGSIFRNTFRCAHKEHQDDGSYIYFCSNKCQHTWEEEHKTCAICGKRLIESIYYANHKGCVCSEECEVEFSARKEEQRWENARKLGNVHVCLKCGKEYIRSGQGSKFCSNSCYKAAVADGWRSTALSKEKIPGTYAPVIAESSHKPSIEDQIRARYRGKKSVIQKPKCSTSLCATCKVSYKDCERMQSGFRILPEGAHYNSEGILVECPKFK